MLLSLQIGLFGNFEGPKVTLLLWGDDNGLMELSGAFRGLSEAANDIAFMLHEQPWAQAVGVKICLRADSAYPGQISLANQGVDWRCSQAQLEDFADMVSSLAAPSMQTGHHYLDVGAGSPIQIIVSKGEYPNDFAP